MEFDELKSDWDTLKTPGKSTADIQPMLSESRHPVLREIRRQLILEVTGWSVFLLCFYTMLDGDRKPAWVNILLVATVFMPLVHNLIGYRFFKNMVNGNTIRQSLENYLSKVRTYGVVSIATRISLMAGLLTFLTYGIALDTKKYIAITIIILFFSIQVFLLYRIWSGRYLKLKHVLSTFK